MKSFLFAGCILASLIGGVIGGVGVKFISAVTVSAPTPACKCSPCKCDPCECKP